MILPELLSPAGDLARLRVAFAYGADAVYIGGKFLSMRAKARNFSSEDMEEGIRYAHSLGKKVYVAVNICAHNEDFEKLDEYLHWLENISADAILVSDLGVFARAKAILKNTEIHISTQANITNFASAAFWQNLGATRVVLARELSLTEIAAIHAKNPTLQLEAFVHGAMCMAYSGRCMISNYLNDRDPNRGECSQPCRFSYALVEQKSGEAFPIAQDDRGTYILNSKDLNMAAHIPDLVNAGISSLKIEGRMKTEYYVAAVTKTYRQALNDYAADPALYTANIPHYQSELQKVGSRGYTTGFFYNKMTAADHDYTAENTQTTPQDFLAIVLSHENNLTQIEQRNKFQIGDQIEILRANAHNYTQTVTELYNEKNEKIQSAPHPKQKLQIKLNHPTTPLDIIRKA